VGDGPGGSFRTAGLRPLLVAGALRVVWEGSKALFALPTYMLPHVHEILGEFLRPAAGGVPWAVIVAQNAG
jgi:ABC-type nitrate/sulfonate/bicarbonate transport system permease component